MLGPTSIALTVLAFAWLGFEIAVRRLSRRAEEPARPLELLCASLSLGAALWIASVWLPALVHRLDRPTMLLRTGVVALAAIAAFLLRTRGRLATRELPHEQVLTYVVPSLPIAGWIGYVLWRSVVVPPLSHDALAYHLPRAVLWIREQAFVPLQLPVDARMRVLPANYELLLADVMLLAGSDAYTEWIGVFFYVAFVVACGALASRFFRSNVGAFAVMLLAAAVPVLLLHTGADKNDTMTGFFMVAAMVWTGRWLSEGDADALALCGVTAIAAAGTKPQGLMLGAALLPIVLWRLFRRDGRLTMKELVRVAAIALVAALLLGGVFYATNSDRAKIVRYDDWENLWQAPWILLTAPFSPSVDLLYVPWSETPWFWKRYEHYFSHLGVPFAVCALLLPFAWILFRRDAPERLRERRAIALAALATLLMMLPVRDVPMPHGIYILALPRYVLFLAPVVFALTVAPGVARLASARPRFAQLALVVLALAFIDEALDAAINDRFVPLNYVAAMREHPGSRLILADPLRAASVADQHAGPREPIAFDAGYAAWIHPAFGRDLQRPVTFIDAEASRIPRGTRWVVIDRSFALFWQHRDFRDAGQWRQYLGQGAPSERDTRLIRRLARDPRFETVYYNEARNQAVFRRVR